MEHSPIDDSVPAADRWLEAPRLDADAARARRRTAVLASEAGEYQPQGRRTPHRAMMAILLALTLLTALVLRKWR